MDNEALSVKDLLDFHTVPDEDSGRRIKVFDALEKRFKKAKQRTYQYNGKSEIVMKFVLSPKKDDRNGAKWKVKLSSKLPEPPDPETDLYISEKAEIFVDNPSQQKLGQVVDLASGKNAEKA